MNPFKSSARVAIEEILKKNMKKTKFGYIHSEEDFSSAVDDLLEFLMTSRSLKSAGDRLLNEGPPVRSRYAISSLPSGHSPKIFE